MRVLALDTTSRSGSLALLVDGRIIEAREGDPRRTHGERLPGEIAEVLGRHGLGVRDVDVFAVAAGPGSFTGLRVGIATVQGLALATGRRVVPVPALEALAFSARLAAGADLIAAWIDAQRREVFAALYETGPAPDLLERLPPIVGRPADVLAAWQEAIAGRRVRFTGSGAAAYREAIPGLAARAAVVVHERVPALAPAVAELAAARAAHAAVPPHAIVPIYIRRPDAELARDARC